MVSTRLQSTSGGETTVEHIFIGVSPVRVIRNVSTVSSSSHEIVPYSQPSASSTAGLQVYVGSTHFLDLPNECIEKIFSYVGYKQVANMRKVCKQLDRVCSGILNSTFQKLQTQMLHRFQTIKGKMPRRESARRNHPLACESDIIETLHMRLTLLQMSFGKHIERKHICFFAGEILDEVYRILHYIKVTPKLARPYKVTDELFDLSTMAMEYFKEHIEPTLPEIAYFGTDFLDFTGSSNKYLSLDSPPHGACKGDESPLANQSDERPALPQQSNMVLRKRIRKIKQGMRRYNYQLSQVRKELRCCRGKISEQQKQIVEYATRLDEYDKKTEEANRKFSTMLQELNKCKTELQYWRSKSTLSSVCNSCGQIVTPLPDQSDVEALTNQGVVLPDLEPTEQLIPEAGTSSSEDVWHKVCVCRVSHGTAWDFKRKVVDQVEPEASGTLDPKNATEQRNKRKSTDKALATLPNKKQRPSSILTTKTRNKRS